MTAIAKSLKQHAADLCRAGVEFVYPPACANCAGPLPASDAVADGTRTTLCADCIDELAPGLAHRCLRCSAPVGPFLETSSGCIHCGRDRFAFETVLSLGVYDGPLRRACLSAKRPGGQVVAGALADLLAVREGESLRGERIDLIVPVPHHWSERLVRTHLPPETMARQLAQHLALPYDVHILAKVKRTASQTSLLPTKRRENLRGAFRASRPSTLTGRTVLLVDDVLTTGTTAHRAARQLRRGGAARVLVAVAARGIGQ